MGVREQTERKTTAFHFIWLLGKDSGQRSENHGPELKPPLSCVPHPRETGVSPNSQPIQGEETQY